MAWKWGKVETFDDFLNEFEKYLREYFTKQIILVNRVKMSEYDDGNIIRFEVSTPSIDIILQIYVPDRVIMESYFTDCWMGGDNHIYNDWNGLVLTEEQFNRFMRLAKWMIEYYEGNRNEFKKARAEAFMNLITATKGKIIEKMVDDLGEDVATAIVLNELGVDDNK